MFEQKRVYRALAVVRSRRKRERRDDAFGGVLPSLLEAAGGRAPPAIDGKRLGRSAKHARYVYGVQTTKCFTNGGEGYSGR